MFIIAYQQLLYGSLVFKPNLEFGPGGQDEKKKNTEKKNAEKKKKKDEAQDNSTTAHHCTLKNFIVHSTLSNAQSDRMQRTKLKTKPKNLRLVSLKLKQRTHLKQRKKRTRLRSR